MALDLEALSVVDAIARRGSFAAAAASLNKTPSALTYTIRKLEDDLDLLIFDRRGTRAKLTPAGQVLLQEGRELLNAAEQTAQRLKALASGWETELRVAVDAVISFDRLRPMIEDFDKLKAPTQLRFSQEVLDGSWEAMLTGRCDLVIGAPYDAPSEVFDAARFGWQLMGEIDWLFCVAPHHPLARQQGLLMREHLLPHRAVAIADTARGFVGRSSGLIEGQKVITVATLEQKLALHLAGLGCGYLPAPFAKPYLQTGRLVALRIDDTKRKVQVRYGWVRRNQGKALAWWLERLAVARVRSRLLGGPNTGQDE
jgi:DNA-binding transcriptional LysR family regulator